MAKDSQVIRQRHDAWDHAWSGAFARSAQRSPLPTIGTSSLIGCYTVAFANDAYLAMTGAGRDAVLSRSVAEVLGDRVDAGTLPQIKAALAGGRSGSWRARLKRGDGTTIPAVIYLSAIFDADDRLIGHCINLTDISTSSLSGVSSSIGSGIYDEAPGFIAIAKGEDHRFEYTNASYKKFVRRDDLIGKKVADVLPEIASQGLIDVLDEVYRTGNAFRASDLPISIRDPATNTLEKFWIDVLYQPMRDHRGAVVGIFCEGQDVTDLHQLNDTLAALQMKMIHASRVNAMGTMAATLAHELNQPLTAITNYLAGARAHCCRATKIDRLFAALDGIDEATQQAVGILDHLRQFTKHRKPHREPFKLREAVADCERLVGSSCPKKIAFNNRVDAETIMIADRIKIQQVLINLLQNACDAMAHDNRQEPSLAQPNFRRSLVTIAAVEDDDGITVSVADTGPGVSTEAIPTMFSWAESAKDDGMGIGLSICRTIVELYRGRIWLEKSTPKGSEFRFWLPCPKPATPGEDGPGVDAAPLQP